MMNAATRTPEVIRVVAGSRHDVALLGVGPCRGTLFVFDLAYCQGRLFRHIVDHGGHFLCRVKRDANGVINPMHSTIPAWNADESLFILYQVNKGHMLYDGAFASRQASKLDRYELVESTRG